MLQDGRQRILGMMSGTSLDGVDAAVLETDGLEIFAFGPSAYQPYSGAEKQVLQAALGQWEGALVDRAAEIVEAAHLEVILGFDGIDLVGFHGQTLAHDPKGRGTLQVGDGARLASRAGVPVVWDFRSQDVAEGGEGAPLAPFYHHALLKRAGVSEPCAVLNLGGVGNITWIDPKVQDPAAPGALLAFDTGPANAPMNDLVARRSGAAFDKGGDLARQGSVHADFVEAYRHHPFFAAPPPKSLDRDAFAEIVGRVDALSTEDALATLAAMAVAGVAEGMRWCPSPPKALWVTGGGRQNGHLMELLSAALSCPVEPIEALGFDGDMLEAQAFAFLATRVVAGMPLSAPGTTGVASPCLGGRISLT